jgi:lipopolysaccharide transport protein LptA/LPS export ABC transporter protein LptC
MTPATTRAVRRAFLGLALSVIVAVGWTLRHPAKRASAPSAAEPQTPRKAKDETVTTGLVFRSFKEGEQSFVLEAESSAAREGSGSRLRGVKLTFGYKGEAGKGTAVITSDECTYDPQLPKAVFTGHVVLTTDDGLELRSESLVYRGDKGVAKTEDHVEFKRGDMSGSSTGAVYSAAEGQVELSADARVRIEGGDEPPTEIRSRQAFMARAEGEARFEDDVEVVQASDTLRSDRLVLSFDPDTHVVSRAIAAGGVDLQTRGGRPLPGLPPESGKGPRHLTARKLDITFRPNRSMEQMIAQNDVDLLLLPGPGEARERRRVRAEVYLIFDCDEQGRIVALRAQKNASLVAEPLKKGDAPTRTARCNHFEATLDPESGDVRVADFSENVVFTRDGQAASARNAHYDASGSVLALEGAPQVVDDQGTLNARAIRLGTRGGGIEAEGDVHHVLKSERRSGLFGGGDSPTLITSKTFSSTSTPQTATYTGEALLRSGKDEVRAGTLVVEQEGEGRRRLTARESVASILHPRSETGGTRATAAMEGRADLMEYDEARSTVVYTGNAVMRQADILTRSPKATLTLTADESGIEKMVAGEPVEVVQGDRHATGTTGTYTPGDDTMVLVGDNVVVKDPQQQSRGRSVIFHMDDDRILVEGQEQGRTETVFQNAPGRP